MQEEGMNAVTEVMDELRKALALVDQLGNARDKAECELAELQRRTSEALAQAVEWQRERDDARATWKAVCMNLNDVEAERDRLRDELAEANARRGDLRTALQWANEERDEARAELAGLPAWQKGCEQALGDLADAEEAIARLYTERDEARALNAEWAQKAATWIASPEAAQRLDGYRDLGQQVAEAQRERDEARADASTAYRRGAEAMREACAECVKRLSHEDGLGMGSQRIEGAIRALPIPEES